MNTTIVSSSDIDMTDLLMKQEQIIDTYGYSIIMSVDEDGLPFCYTVGRAQHDLPEMIIFGMHEEGVDVINGLARVLREETSSGYHHIPDWKTPLYAGEAREISQYARWAYNRQAQINPITPVKMMQVIIPDENGRMPWEIGCNVDYIAMQPLKMTPPPGRRLN